VTVFGGDCAAQRVHTFCSKYNTQCAFVRDAFACIVATTSFHASLHRHACIYWGWLLQ
jgi:hypothetical protein